MPSLNSVIYALGISSDESDIGLTIYEIVDIVGEVKEEKGYDHVYNILLTYPQFFKRSFLPKGIKSRQKYVYNLTGYGKTFYNRIKDIYDLDLDKLLVPQIERMNYVTYKEKLYGER